MREMTLSELSRLDAAAGEADEVFQMDEDAFRLFYERTARPVWAYLARMTGDARQADDLLQEAYYRLLRAKTTYETEAHRRNYLFRIATNLVHDMRRRPRVDAVPLSDDWEHADPRQSDAAGHAARRVDLARDGAAQAARARVAVVGLRAGIVAPGNRRHPELEDIQHQGAVVSRAPAPRDDAPRA